MKNNSRTVLFYDWAKILKKSNGSSLNIISIFGEMLSSKETRIRFNGYSFLLNPQAFIEDTISIGSDKAIYAGVASFRNYFDYKYFKDARLRIELCEVPASQLRSNRLLRLDKDYIYFRYEDIQNGN